MRGSWCSISAAAVANTAAWFIFGFAGETPAAEIRPAALFSDRMVLQRDMPLPVWGTADPGTVVEVAFAGQKQSTQAGSDGRWEVRLEPLLASSKPRTLTIGRMEIRDVVVGEVWIASGQSNMGMPVVNILEGEVEAKAVDDPLIRFFHTPFHPRAEPTRQLSGQWMACRGGHWSAVAYFFARDLHRALAVPVGIIRSSHAGSRIEPWIRREAIEPLSAAHAKITEWEAILATPESIKKRQEQLTGAWKREVAKAEAEGKKPPAEPIGMDVPNDPRRPSALWNGMIAPLAPYAVRGFIWYQGESNTSSRDDAFGYREQLSAMIRDWRAQWGRDDMPFLFVQMPNFGPRDRAGTVWPMLRESQAEALSLPKVGMAVTIDVGDRFDLHPRNKKPIGQRLAQAALAIEYGQFNSSPGPMVESVVFNDGAARIRFRNRAAGLVSKSGDTLTGFELSGSDDRFVTAQARIDGNTVVVQSPKVPQPLAVRYAWADDPDVSLFNADNLPAAPFRFPAEPTFE